MTRDNIESMIESKRPFTISMANDRQYTVPHRDFISFTRKERAGRSVGPDRSPNRGFILFFDPARGRGLTRTPSMRSVRVLSTNNT